jgi:ribosomal protein S18 acetylase RimI-like enzyme
MPQVEVIEADAATVEVAAGLFDAYRQFYGQQPDFDGARRFLSERLMKRESVVLLAAQGRPLQGLGLAQVYPSFSSVRLRPIWILNDLFVAPQARRQGIGRLLLDAVATRAQAAGACRVVLSTAKDNAGAKALYEKSGYRLDATFDHYELPLGRAVHGPTSPAATPVRPPSPWRPQPPASRSDTGRSS